MTRPLPYQVAVLCYIFDQQSRALLLNRRKPPNQDLYSPVGGKLDVQMGESPPSCAVREIREETGLELPIRHLHLTGIVSEAGYEDASHWLMFLYEVTVPVSVAPRSSREGELDWHETEQINSLAIPETDRQVIWPLFWRYRGGFFSAHIHCDANSFTWRIEQPSADATG